MSSNKRLKVILSKVDWCGHCKDFLPVFNESKNLIKNNKTLKNVSVDFEVYDMEQDKGIFQIKNDKLSKTVEIGHAQKSEDFVKLITNAYMGFTQQKGGNQDPYKQKYLKYKAKYLQYKAQFGGVDRFTLIIKHHFDDKQQRWNYYIVDNEKPSDIETFDPKYVDKDLATKYPNIVCRADSASPALIWPTKYDSDWVKESDRTKNYNYQKEHEQKFMKNFMDMKPPNPGLPYYDNLLVITFN